MTPNPDLRTDPGRRQARNRHASRFALQRVGGGDCRWQPPPRSSGPVQADRGTSTTASRAPMIRRAKSSLARCGLAYEPWSRAQYATGAPSTVRRAPGRYGACHCVQLARTTQNRDVCFGTATAQCLTKSCHGNLRCAAPMRAVHRAHQRPAASSMHTRLLNGRPDSARWSTKARRPC